MTAARKPDEAELEPALGRAALIQALSAGARLRLVGAGSLLAVEAGAVLCSAGEEGDALFILMEGEVEVRRTLEGGREVRLAALQAGAVLGEMAALDGGPRSADMVATRRSRLWRIPRRAVLEALETEPMACMALIAELCRRLRDADAVIEDAVILDLGGRLARLLLEQGPNGRAITLSQSEMGRRIAASREKVNRKLQQWQQQVVIEIGRTGVRVLQPQALEAVIASQRAG
jgi:CRP-like cAMP-binding protein